MRLGPDFSRFSPDISCRVRNRMLNKIVFRQSRFFFTFLLQHVSLTLYHLCPFSSLPLIYSRRVVVSYKRKYVHKLLVNRLLKPAQEKVWLSELTVPQ